MEQKKIIKNVGVRRTAMDIKISKIKVDPNDIIIVECVDQLKSPQLKFLSEEIKQVFPNNKCVILDRGTKLRKVVVSDDVSKMTQKEFSEYLDHIIERINSSREN